MAIIEKLHMLKFRNLSDQYLELNKKINVFIGSNAQGKTNFIESIYYLGHNRSFKTKNTKDLIPFNEESIQINALVDDFKIVLKRSKNNSSVLVNEKKIATNSELTKHLPIQLISPDRGFIVGGSPKLKRSCLDWGVYHRRTELSRTYKAYNKGLKNINSLLSNNINTLDDWFAQIAPLSVEISVARDKYIKKLSVILGREPLRTIIDLLGADNNLRFNFQSGWTKDVDSFDKDSIYNYLLKNKPLFLKTKHLAHGPHKASLDFFLNNKNENFLSRGEQKTLSIIFWLLQVLLLVEEEKNPIVIIDDISSELDRKKIDLLINFFIDLNLQIFVTDIGNSSLNIDNKIATFFKINNGQITQI